MPASIDLDKREHASKGKSSMELQDNEKVAVNRVSVEGKMLLPILLQNGSHLVDADKTDSKVVYEEECDRGSQKISDFKGRLKLLRVNDQVRELQTTLRDRETSRSDFIFYADRLIRLVVEEGLNQLPFDECCVTTPTGASYKGLKFRRGICGVSIVRSGEAMEKGLRECCRSIRIGKVLIKVEEETNKPTVCYARFPPDIHQRRVFLMYPLLSVAMVLEKYRQLILLTTEVYEDVPTQFGRKYFGTD